MYVMKMSPTYKDYLWGGTKLKSNYNKESSLDIIAESWELACHPNGESVVINGKHAGKTLSDVVMNDVIGYLGRNCFEMTKFPLLIKLIDSKNDLSIQVHPDDEFAKKFEGESGKTEVWIILDCENDAYIYYGVKHEISRDKLKENITDGSIINHLNKVNVKKGDVYFVKPGTIHAIGAGIVIAEIQQNSDVTYRLYDFDRLDAHGMKRPLHIEKGTKCADLEPTLQVEPREGYLAYCKYFSVKRIKGKNSYKGLVGSDSFQALLITGGEGYIQHDNMKMDFIKGDCFFVPANLGEFFVNGNFEILQTEVTAPSLPIHPFTDTYIY